MIAGNQFSLIIVTPHIQREFNRTFRAKLITRAILTENASATKTSHNLHLTTEAKLNYGTLPCKKVHSC